MTLYIATAGNKTYGKIVGQAQLQFYFQISVFNNQFEQTSLWNRDDCVCVLMGDRDSSVRDLSQQVH